MRDAVTCDLVGLLLLKGRRRSGVMAHKQSQTSSFNPILNELAAMEKSASTSSSICRQSFSKSARRPVRRSVRWRTMNASAAPCGNIFHSTSTLIITCRSNAGGMRRHQMCAASASAMKIWRASWQGGFSIRSWPAWTAWLTARSGDPVFPPPLGDAAAGFVALEDSPGSYT